MLSAGIAAALVLGLLAWRVGLPPLVGFLLAGISAEVPSPYAAAWLLLPLLRPVLARGPRQ